MIDNSTHSFGISRIFKRTGHVEIVNSGFESGMDGWVDGGGDRVWARHTGSTPSGNTGPTGAQSGSWYVYCETSAAGSGGKTFYLNKSGIGMMSINFYYHLWVGLPELYIEVQPYLALEKWTGFEWAELWRVTGDQGSSWVYKSDVGLGSASLIRFKGMSAEPDWVSGNGAYLGDMSVDNINIKSLT